MTTVGAPRGLEFRLALTSPPMRGEQVRALLAILVVGVAVRLLIGLVRTPEDIYSIVAGTP